MAEKALAAAIQEAYVHGVSTVRSTIWCRRRVNRDIQEPSQHRRGDDGAPLCRPQFALCSGQIGARCKTGCCPCCGWASAIRPILVRNALFELLILVSPSGFEPEAY
jgi:hypothetical protein